MLIAQALAADAAPEMTPEVQAPGAVTDPAAETSGSMYAMQQIGLVLVLVVLFYVLLIMPQQRRFKEHRAMLGGLKKGDPVVTGGGLVGKIDTMVDDNEVIIDLGNGMKVTALRSTIHAKNTPILKGKPANDQKTSVKK